MHLGKTHKELKDLWAAGGADYVTPYETHARSFVVNLLRGEQKRLATVYADAYPVGPSPFPAEGEPVIDDALAHLRCRVEAVVPVDAARVVLGRAVGTGTGDAEEALIHFRREYHTLP